MRTDRSRPVDLSLTSQTLQTALSDDELASISQAALEYPHNPAGLAPASIEFKGETWNLVSALELDIAEAEVAPASDLGLGLSGSDSGVKIRLVKSTDLTFGSGISVQYAEVSLPFPHLPSRTAVYSVQ